MDSDVPSSINEPHIPVRGRLVDSDTKMPIANATVVPLEFVAPGTTPNETLATTSDGVGEFRVSVAFRGIEIRHSSYPIQEGWLSEEADEPIDVKISAGTVVSGLIRQADGKPVENATVRCRAWEAKTSNDGRFSFRILPPQDGEIVDVYVDHESFFSYSKHVKPADLQKIDVRLFPLPAVGSRVER